MNNDAKLLRQKLTRGLTGKYYCTISASVHIYLVALILERKMLKLYVKTFVKRPFFAAFSHKTAAPPITTATCITHTVFPTRDDQTGRSEGKVSTVFQKEVNQTGHSEGKRQAERQDWSWSLAHLDGGKAIPFRHRGFALPRSIHPIAAHVVTLGCVRDPLSAFSWCVRTHTHDSRRFVRKRKLMKW